MKSLISAREAGNILLIGFGALAIFHILVLLKVVPANIVWGGQVGDEGPTFMIMEVTALLLTLLFSLIVAVKVEYIKITRFRSIIDMGIWLIFAYLILNTIANLASGVMAENVVFAPIGLLMAFFALRLGIEK
jgi:hypothetical protein